MILFKMGVYDASVQKVSNLEALNLDIADVPALFTDFLRGPSGPIRGFAVRTTPLAGVGATAAQIAEDENFVPVPVDAISLSVDEIRELIVGDFSYVKVPIFTGMDRIDSRKADDIKKLMAESFAKMQVIVDYPSTITGI